MPHHCPGRWCPLASTALASFTSSFSWTINVNQGGMCHITLFDCDYALCKKVCFSHWRASHFIVTVVSGTVKRSKWFHVCAAVDYALMLLLFHSRPQKFKSWSSIDRGGHCPEYTWPTREDVDVDHNILIVEDTFVLKMAPEFVSVQTGARTVVFSYL